MSNAMKTEKQDGALIVTFNRPAIRNPRSIHVVDELMELTSRLSDDISRLVFTGTDGVFASGADLKEIAGLDGKNAASFAERGQRLMKSIQTLPIPTFAAVNGYCYGGALDLALSCNVRIASLNAEFRHPGANLGIMTGWGGTQRLPRLVGEAAALEMFLTSKRLGASEALGIGLIDALSEDPVPAAINYRL